MLSYLLVIIRPKELENRLQVDRKANWHEDIRMDTNTKKKSEKKQHCLFSILVPQIEYLVLSNKCVKGVIQKSSLLPAHIR